MNKLSKKELNLVSETAENKSQHKELILPGLKQMDIVTLPREVLKWIQSLDLTYSVKNPKKDFNNGFLVAQILFRYFADEIQIQMHSINNGYSLEKKRDNWLQIAKYLKHIPNINIKIDNIDSLIENHNNEILFFLIQLYQELTKRKISQLEGKKVTTDVDDVNKTFLLKETGEVELLKRDQKTTEKNTEEIQKTMKSVASALTAQKNSSMIMKGEMKVISNNVSNVDNKNFRLKISETKTFERSTKVIRENKENQQTNLYSPHLRNDFKGEDAAQNYVQLKINSETREEDPKIQKMNPFDRLEDIVLQKAKSEFKNEYDGSKRTVVNILRNINEYSHEFLGMLLSEINKIVDEYYNLMTTHINEYLSLFYCLIETYLNKEIDNRKFQMIHESLNVFFVKSLKIRSDEIVYIFKYMFVPKLFESIKSIQNKKILYPLCEIIFKILDPLEKQQVEFFKLFKDNIHDEVILYECFSHLHEMFPTYSENLIDVCLFYVLNGITHINPDIRYHSLCIFYKYVNINLNFFLNLEKKLEKLSRREEDKEVCLLLVKIGCLSLKQAFLNKSKPREVKKKSQFFNETDDSGIQQYLNEVQIGNSIVKNILPRFTGDPLWTFFFTTAICENLFENAELYKILLNCLFQANDNIIKTVFCDEELNQSIVKIFENTIFRHEPKLPSKISNWNYSYFLRAFDLVIIENYKDKFSDKFYEFFLRFIIKNGINPEENLEIWKTNFKFLKLVIEDCKFAEKINRSLELLDSFILCEPISRQVFEECYDHIHMLILFLLDNKTEINSKLIDILGKKLKYWNSSNAVSSILKEGLRKLIEIIG